MVDRVLIEAPKGELLPAEERLENVLAAIVDRIKVERSKLDKMDDFGIGVTQQRSFLSGLDIACSLAKTESLRRDGVETVSRVGSEVNTRSGSYPSVPYVKQEDGTWKPKYE